MSMVKRMNNLKKKLVPISTGLIRNREIVTTGSTLLVSKRGTLRVEPTESYFQEQLDIVWRTRDRPSLQYGLGIYHANAWYYLSYWR